MSGRQAALSAVDVAEVVMIRKICHILLTLLVTTFCACMLCALGYMLVNDMIPKEIGGITGIVMIVFLAGFVFSTLYLREIFRKEQTNGKAVTPLMAIKTRMKTDIE